MEVDYGENEGSSSEEEESESSSVSEEGDSSGAALLISGERKNERKMRGAQAPRAKRTLRCLGWGGGGRIHPTPSPALLPPFPLGPRGRVTGRKDFCHCPHPTWATSRGSCRSPAPPHRARPLLDSQGDVSPAPCLHPNRATRMHPCVFFPSSQEQVVEPAFITERGYHFYYKPPLAFCKGNMFVPWSATEIGLTPVVF